MTPSEREEIEKVANSLVQHIDEMGMNHIRGYKVLMITETILTQVAKARAEERERCAKIAESHGKEHGDMADKFEKKSEDEFINPRAKLDIVSCYSHIALECDCIASAIRNKLEKE